MARAIHLYTEPMEQPSGRNFTHPVFPRTTQKIRLRSTLFFRRQQAAFLDIICRADDWLTKARRWRTVSRLQYLLSPAMSS